jgi:uncharacterized protein (DUF2252 family)
MALDVAGAIAQFNAGREPERLQLKYRKMRSSAFAFFRGSCHLFYARWPKDAVAKSAPLAWACGDLHLENFGSYKADNRLVYFDINDFDEAALAPATWDLVRLLGSVHVASKEMGLRRREAKALCSTTLTAFLATLTRGKALWMERDNAQGLVGDLLNSLRQRNRPQFLDSRTLLKSKLRRLRVDGSKALPASPAQHQRVLALMRDFANTQNDPGFFRVLDVARRVAGTGSLGQDRFVILVEGKGSPNANYLLDLKHVTPSCLTPHLKAKQPRWPSQAQRVVSVAERMQAVPMAFTHTLPWGAGSGILRGLQPSEDRIGLAQRQSTPEQMHQLMLALGQLLAWAQLRSAGRSGSAPADDLMAFAALAARPKWQAHFLDLAEASAVQARADAAMFNAAYDDRAFEIRMEI